MAIEVFQRYEKKFYAGSLDLPYRVRGILQLYGSGCWYNAERGSIHRSVTFSYDTADDSSSWRSLEEVPDYERKAAAAFPTAAISGGPWSISGNQEKSAGLSASGGPPSGWTEGLPVFEVGPRTCVGAWDEYAGGAGN